LFYIRGKHRERGILRPRKKAQKSTEKKKNAKKFRKGEYMVTQRRSACEGVYQSKKSRRVGESG